jgi:crotonobetainyl-CoA:carnitine CoA-transferase CaiB-like acyl-CoA transferase
MLALGSHLIAANSNPDLKGGWHLPAPSLPPEFPSMAADGPVEVSFPDEFAFSEFYRALGLPEELCVDERFLDKLNLVMHWDEYLELIGPYIAKWSAERVKEFVTTFEGMGVVGHTYRTLMTDPQVDAMGVLRHDASGKSVGLNPPWELAGTPARDLATAPRLGDRIAVGMWNGDGIDEVDSGLRWGALDADH